MERMIDAAASRNEPPKLIGRDGVVYPTFSDKAVTLAYPAFSDKFDWKDQKRVQAAVVALTQDDSNDLWGCLVEHFDDKRYAGTTELDEDSPFNDQVGSICLTIARNKLQCAYLRHLEPGKTFHYGGPTFNHVPVNSRDFLPDGVQRELHDAPQLYTTDDGLAGWYRARKGKPLYELQIEVCEWAVKTVEDARGAAEKPKKKFIAAVRKEIESLKKNKKPVVDPSPWASPMSEWFSMKMSEGPNWKFYTKESALATRDDVLNAKVGQ